MNCPVCSGRTSVVDRRGQKRRRECTACGHRFNTFELLEDDVHRPVQAPARAARARAPKPAAPVAPVVVAPVAAPATPIERQLSTRERLQRLREERDLSMLEDDL